MIEKMVADMASDLGIAQFKGEDATQFQNRVLYSAMSCWVKTSALDQPITSLGTHEVGVSKRHITDKCMRIMQELMLRAPCSTPWFDMESDSVVTLMCARLLRHGDLLHAGFQTNLTLAPETTIVLNEKLSCIKGSLLHHRFAYSGLGMVAESAANANTISVESQDSATWLKAYIKNAWWKGMDRLDEKMEYFNAYKRTNNNHTCWQTVCPKAVNGYFLARRGGNGFPHDYLLIRVGQPFQIHRIDPFLKNIGEHWRFLFAMRRMAENPPTGSVHPYPDHVKLSLHVYMPERESRLLESFAWPHNRVDDKLEWDILPPVWQYIKPYLTQLGIEIMEVPGG